MANPLCRHVFSIRFTCVRRTFWKAGCIALRRFSLWATPARVYLFMHLYSHLPNRRMYNTLASCTVKA